MTVAVTAPETGTDILSFSFPEQTEDEDATINAIDHTVAIIEVAYGTELNALVPTFTLSPEATATVGTVAQTSGITANVTNGVTYTITAEDSTVQHWTVTVAVTAPETGTDILSFSFPEQVEEATINTIDHTVATEVAYGTELNALVPTFTLSSEATVTVNTVAQTSDTTANDFTNAVTYTITAEGGSTVHNWTVTVTVVAPETGTDILSFSFPQQAGETTINTTDHTVVIEVAYGTDVDALVPTFTLSSGATATVGNTVKPVPLPPMTSPML